MMRLAASAAVRPRSSIDISAPPTMPRTEHHAMQGKQGGIRGSTKLGEHTLVRIRPAIASVPKVRYKIAELTGRPAQRRKMSGRDIPSDQSNVSRPSKRLNSSPSPCRQALPSSPVPHHDEHLPGPGQQLENLIDQARAVVHRPAPPSRCLQAARREKSLIDGREQKRRFGKEVLLVSRANNAAGAATVTIRSGCG